MKIRHSRLKGLAMPYFFVAPKLENWHCRYGSWWMVQVVFDGWLSFGIHIDYKHRRDAWGHTYGPYIDFHLLKMILSIGYHPYLSTDLERVSSYSRGGAHYNGEGRVIPDGTIH